MNHTGVASTGSRRQAFRKRELDIQDTAAGSMQLAAGSVRCAEANRFFTSGCLLPAAGCLLGQSRTGMFRSSRASVTSSSSQSGL